MFQCKLKSELLLNWIHDTHFHSLRGALSKCSSWIFNAEVQSARKCVWNLPTRIFTAKNQSCKYQFHRNSQLVFLQLVSVEIGVALYEAKHNIILLQIIIVLFVTKIHNLDFWMNFKSEKCFIEIHKSDFQCRNPSCEFITATWNPCRFLL